MRTCLDHVRRVLIIGDGFIGLEVAAALARGGVLATVPESAPALLPPTGGSTLATWLQDMHARAGVRIECGVQITGIYAAHPGVLQVECADGGRYDADVLIAGIGIVSNTELAIDCGLQCLDCIRVDKHARTSDQRIVAFGDCARAPNEFLGREARLDTVQNAIEQAKVAAATAAGGYCVYRQVPWVWSDPYGVRIQMTGECNSPDVIGRGDLNARSATLLYFDGERLRGLAALNRPADFGVGRRLLRAGIPVAPKFAADPAARLETLLPPRAPACFAHTWPPEVARVAARTSAQGASASA